VRGLRQRIGLRHRGACARSVPPFYTGGKRGEVVRTRTAVLQAHTHQWLAPFGNQGLGEYRAELRRAVAAIQSYLQAHHLPEERAVPRLDGQYGTGAVLSDLAGLGYVMRGKDYRLLDRAEIQAKLSLPPDQQITHPESGMVRTLYDCSDLPLDTSGKRCRVVVATHPAKEMKSRVGVTRSGVVYELFLSSLPQSAFTSADVVALYLHRGAFEIALADEDLEQDPDRWCSHAACGQEAWQIISQWMWNLRLELGHQLHPDPVRTTEFAPAHLSAPEEAVDSPSLLQGYGPVEVALPWKQGRISGRDFPLQPDGTLRCPVPPDSRSLRKSGAEKPMEACAWCMRPASAVATPVLCGSSANGMARPPPSRAFVSVLLHPLVVGSAPLRLSRLEPAAASTGVHATAVPSMRRGTSRACPLCQPSRPAFAPFPRTARTLSSLVGRAAGS